MALSPPRGDQPPPPPLGLAVPYLDAVHHVPEQGRALGPGAHQLHRPVEVLDILAVHLEERGQLLQDVPEPRVHVPLWGVRSSEKPLGEGSGERDFMGGGEGRGASA